MLTPKIYLKNMQGKKSPTKNKHLRVIA